MVESVFEQIGDQIEDTAQKASQAVSAAADALEESVITARRMAKRGKYAAMEFLEDTRKHVKLRPIETIAVTFAAGIATGAAIGWMMRRS